MAKKNFKTVIVNKTVKADLTELGNGEMKARIDLRNIEGAEVIDGNVKIPLDSFPCQIEGTMSFLDVDRETGKIIIFKP